MCSYISGKVHIRAQCKQYHEVLNYVVDLTKEYKTSIREFIGKQVVSHKVAMLVNPSFSKS